MTTVTATTALGVVEGDYRTVVGATVSDVVANHGHRRIGRRTQETDGGVTGEREPHTVVISFVLLEIITLNSLHYND